MLQEFINTVWQGLKVMLCETLSKRWCSRHLSNRLSPPRTATRCANHVYLQRGVMSGSSSSAHGKITGSGHEPLVTWGRQSGHATGRSQNRAKKPRCVHSPHHMVHAQVGVVWFIYPELSLEALEFSDRRVIVYKGKFLCSKKLHWHMQSGSKSAKPQVQSTCLW